MSEQLVVVVDILEVAHCSADFRVKHDVKGAGADKIGKQFHKEVNLFNLVVDSDLAKNGRCHAEYEGHLD